MIRNRILQLVAITLCCVVIVGCKPKPVPQAEETPMDSTEATMSQTDSAMTISDTTDSSMTKTIADSLKTESTDKTASPDDNPKEAEAVAKDKNESGVDPTKKDKAPESEIADSISQSDTTTTVEMNADSVAIDTTVVDSLWNRLLVDVKIMNDTTLNQADSESVNRDSLLEVLKKQKLDSLLIGVINPPENTNAGSTESGGWPWWLTVLAGVAGLLFGGLLTWLISKLSRKKESSQDDEKEIKPKLKVKDLSDLDDEKNNKLKDFYKRMIIK